MDGTTSSSTKDYALTSTVLSCYSSTGKKFTYMTKEDTQEEFMCKDFHYKTGGED